MKEENKVQEAAELSEETLEKVNGGALSVTNKKPLKPVIPGLDSDEEADEKPAKASKNLHSGDAIPSGSQLC